MFVPIAASYLDIQSLLPASYVYCELKNIDHEYTRAGKLQYTQKRIYSWSGSERVNEVPIHYVFGYTNITYIKSKIFS